MATGAGEGESVYMRAHLLMFLPYNEKTKVVEDALANWIGDAENLKYFDTTKPMTFTAVVDVVIAGSNKHGDEVTMTAPHRIFLVGNLKADDEGRIR